MTNPGPESKSLVEDGRLSATSARRVVFEQLLRDAHDGLFGQRALRCRIELRTPHALILAFGDDCDLDAVGRLIAGAVRQAVHVSCVTESPRHVAVVVPAASHSLWAFARRSGAEAAASRHACVLMREPVVGLRALRAQYLAGVADASIALALGLDGPVIDAGELVIGRMLSLISAAEQDLVLKPLRRILALPAEHRASYMRTLELLHRHGGSLVRAADVLHVHPNTVRYRVERIEEMTGMCLADPRHRMRVDLATLLVHLRGYPADQSPDFRLSLRLRGGPTTAGRSAGAWR
ncbi:MAG TPA: helix-turn-helix domain-containing protein [Candidatus Angelobacter sp.]|jgi:sugar diacid utilization regulator|nr:helix-turn-helix domain-containing protein [Candidatus Angelobacter sp.]